MARRFGIAGLAAALIGGALTSTQAGIIPWAYDAIFGPNYYGGYPAAYSANYGPSPMSYSVGYSPCGPGGCGVPYAPSNCNTCAPCSTGTCAPRVSYCAPCEVASSSTCTPQTTWKSQQPTPATPKAEVGTKVRINNNGGVSDSELDDPLGNRRYPPKEETLKRPNLDGATTVEPRSDSTSTGESTGFGPTNSNNKTFEPPKNSTDKNKALPLNSDVEGQASRRPLNLDNKSTWSLSSNLPERRAVATQARFGEAKIARRPSNVKADPATVASGSAVVRK